MTMLNEHSMETAPVGIHRAAAEAIRAHHSELLARFGHNDARVVWNSRESQESRFEVLAQVGQLDGASILDVGCGLGDLSEYLRTRGVANLSYLGIDINDDMLAAARRKYPNATFERRDLLACPLENDRFDFVFGSGIFNMVIPNWAQVTFGTLRRMYDCARKAVAVNFLSRLSGNANPAARYSLPSEILAFLERQLSGRFVLRHDYRKNDFTVFIYK